MRLKPREISVALTRPGHFTGADQLAPVADLPLPPEELLDLLDRARINHPQDIYKVTIDRCNKEYLHSHLEGQPLNILELNHLANTLADLSPPDTYVFEGLMKMWKEDHAAPVARIISLALAAKDNPFIYGIMNDTQLGKLSFNDDFYEELVDLPDEQAKYLDFAKLGRERRESESGIFTSNGYVAKILTDEEIDRYYVRNSFSQLEDMLPEESLRVELSRYDLDIGEPGHLEMTITLPITEEQREKVLDELECPENALTVIARYCVVPSLVEIIKVDEPLKNLNALAVCLDGARAMGKLPLYKALLEATRCETVEEAANLGCRLHEYRLDATITDAAQYARKELEKKLGPEETGRMARNQDLCYYGRELANKNNIAVTEYGYLTRVDGGPILSLNGSPALDMPAPISNTMGRQELVARAIAAVEQDYLAYKAAVGCMDTDTIFEEADTIAATRIVYDQLTDPTWPDEVYQSILQCANPLLEVRDHWREQGQPSFDHQQFNISMEDFLERTMDGPNQQIVEQRQ